MSRSERFLALVLSLSLAACSNTADTNTTTTVRTRPTTTTTADVPAVLEATMATESPSLYGLVEMVLDIDAMYENPFDQRQVTVDASFSGPEGETLDIPAFWDGEEEWRVRFTPTAAGEWGYAITVRDSRGQSEPLTGSIEVSDSDHHGFIRIGDQVDPSYSPRYFAYEDGTPWYGRGHADLDMSLGGASPDGEGLRKFTEMSGTGENYEMWWPMWGNNFIQESYEDYAPAQMSIIDYVVSDAEAKGIALVFTVWGHQFLRTPDHEWPDERWSFNGFSELTDIDGFFTDTESWAWQENLYRYIIARWSYSPALLMWQTVTEINGTESYQNTDSWHEKVNAYFQDNDPYRHPTTATKSGAQDWPEGHAVMDVPQVHLYHVFGDNPIADGTHFADWTTLMWDREEKPNWIGEYGNRVQAQYPEFMHNANWTSLATGAAMTPTEWNDQNAFGIFDEEMQADMKRFSDFVDAVPLVVYRPERIAAATSHPEVRAWGLAGDLGGVVWVQDHALDGAAIDDVKTDQTVRSELTLTFDPLAEGTWTVDPYDTWSGQWLASVEVNCASGPCQVVLPDFHSDLALHLHR